MHSLLERLDGAASTIVPLAYLAGLMLGTMSYFAGITLDAGLAVGVALALAAELHSFLEQRRVRALWAAYHRSADDSVRDHLARQLHAHLAILAALVAFSAVNATAFAAETWHPASGFLPTWLQIGIRGAVVPVLFLLTGALSPLTTTAGDELATASRTMLRKTIRSTLRQWNARIDRARRRGVDLAPVAVSLMLDAGDADSARRVRLIADGLASAERGPALDSHPTFAEAALVAPMPSQDSPGERQQAALAATTPAAAQAHDEQSPAPPTGRGSKRRASKRGRRPRQRPARMLQLVPEGEADAEARIRALLAREPGLSVRQISERAQVSSGTASKWRRVLRAEQERERQLASVEAAEAAE